MRRFGGRLALTCGLSFGPALVSAAQPLTPATLPAAITERAFQPLTPDQDRELSRWLAGMDEWRRFDAKWFNRPARDSLGRRTERLQRPAPPSWLPASCKSATLERVLDLHPRLSAACRLLDDPWAPVLSMPTAVQVVRAEEEKPSKYTSFLERVHIDGLWSTPVTNGRSYGLIGSHLTLVDIGPVQLFGPPGVLVLSLPDGDGSRRLTIGVTWGLSVRLTDVTLPGDKPMTLFLNLSKVWVGGETNDVTNSGHDIIGFSLAPGRRRTP
jgi:hypothetical protein